MAWDEHGVWVGRVEQENGEWLIGDILSPDHPGYVAADSPFGLLVKYWKAADEDLSGKYAGRGHEPLLPAHGGKVELVQVLFGYLCCECRDRIRTLGRGSGEVIRGDTIVLMPDEKRRWFLGNSFWGWGVTICQNANSWLTTPAAQEREIGFEYRVLDTAETPPNEWPPALRAPTNLTAWSRQLIMMFRGCVHRQVENTITHALRAHQNRYAYTKPETGGNWWPVVEEGKRTNRVIATVVYY